MSELLSSSSSSSSLSTLLQLAQDDPALSEMLGEIRYEWRVLLRIQQRFRSTSTIQRLLGGKALPPIYLPHHSIIHSFIHSLIHI